MYASETPIVEDESGFTLIELMTAMAILIVIFIATLAMLDFAVKSEPEIAERNNSVRDAQVEVERMVRELRTSYDVLASTSTTLSVLTYLNRSACAGADDGGATARKCRIDYSCASGACTRTVSEEDGSAAGPVRTLATGLTSSSVFSYSPSSSEPTAINVTLSLKAADRDGEDAITLSDGAALRNLSGGEA